MSNAAIIKSTELFRVMLASGDYEDADEVIEVIEEMRERVLTGGEDPDEVLHEEGYEPDYVMDLLF